MSDRRAKENIVRIGRLADGLYLYLFCYLPELRDRHGHGRRLGLMADEVARLMPAAVTVGDDGYLRVDYGMVRRLAPKHREIGCPGLA